jgi:hypothetical protein
MVMLLKMMGVAVGPNALCASPSQNLLKEYVVPLCNNIVSQAPEASVHPVL